MALLEADFTLAIEEFALCWEGLSNPSERHGLGDWNDMSIMESFGTRYLRVAKCIEAPAPASCSMKDDNDITGEIAVDEDDPEALVTPAVEHEDTHVVQYDIVYSTIYQVPVLYLTFADPSTKRTISLPTPDEVYQLLVPNNFRSSMRDVGVMGALSMAEHPVVGTPSYFVHPCRTQEALEPLIVSARPGSQTWDATDYLLLWFGVIGASVGLSVPVVVARLLADDRGEMVATKLGNC